MYLSCEWFELFYFVTLNTQSVIFDKLANRIYLCNPNLL